MRAPLPSAGRRSAWNVLPALCALGCGPAVIGVDPGASGIGRACIPGAPAEVLAAQAVASMYHLAGGVRDLQLVETGLEATRIAVYRGAPGEAAPQEVFAAVIALAPDCAAVVSQGDTCDPFAEAPIFLPAFPEGSAALGLAVREPWEPKDEPVVQVEVTAESAQPEPGFPEASARGTCVFGVGATADGRPVPYTLFAWASEARTVEELDTGERYVTEARTELEPAGGPEPRGFTLRSEVADAECLETDDRPTACIGRCALRGEAAGAGEDFLTACENECAGAPAGPGTWCSGKLDTVRAPWRAVREEDGRDRWQPAEEEALSVPLDAACLLAAGAPLACVPAAAAVPPAYSPSPTSP